MPTAIKRSKISARSGYSPALVRAAKSELLQEQTPLRADFFSSYIDEFIQPPDDSILKTKGGGRIGFYEAVRQDGQVITCFEQLFSEIFSRELEVVPGGDAAIDKKAAEDLELQLKNIGFDDICKKMAWGKFWGFSVGEAIYAIDNGKVTLKTIKTRRRNRFHFNYSGEIRWKAPVSVSWGVPLTPQKYWVFQCGNDNDDDPNGRALAYWLYWPTFFKRSSMRWWILFLETFAKPHPHGTYPPGADEEVIAALEDALEQFGQQDHTVSPEGTVISLIEASRSGKAEYGGLVDLMNSEITKIILGQTMTTEDGSSRSQAEVHENTKTAIAKALSDLLCQTFNDSISKWLAEWNFPGAAIPKIWRKFESPVDLKAEADKDTVLSALGIKLKTDAITGKYGEEYEVPEEEETLTQLSGDQVSALVSIVTSAQTGSWKPELVAGMISGAWPGWSKKAIDAITKNLGTEEGAAGQAPPPIDPAKAADLLDKAQFSKPDLEEDPLLPIAEALLGRLSAVEFAKIPEGQTKSFNGREYRLENSRWRRVGDRQELKSKIKPLNFDDEESKIENATTEQLSHLEKKYAGILERLESEPNPFADHKDHPFAKDIDELEALRTLSEERRGAIEQQESDDYEDTDEEHARFMAELYSKTYAPWTASTDKRGNLVLRDEPSEQPANIRFPGLSKDMTETMSPREITLKKDAEGRNVVKVSARTTTITNPDGTVRYKDQEFQPRESFIAAEGFEKWFNGAKPEKSEDWRDLGEMVYRSTKSGYHLPHFPRFDAEFRGVPSKTEAKKKKCKDTSHSCGFTCISGKKTCRITMTIEQQQAAKKLKAELRAAKPVETAKEQPTGGGLATVPKKAEEQKGADPGARREPYSDIHDKYASDNPTDADAQSWLKDVIEARNNPTAANVEARTAEEMKRKLYNDAELGNPGVKEGRFSSRVVDKKSYALARQAHEAYYKRTEPDGAARRTNPDEWYKSRTTRGDGLKVSDIPALEKKIATTKSEAVKKTAMRQLEALREDQRREPEMRARAEQDAAKWRNIYDAPKKERLKQLEAEYDRQQATTKAEMEANYADIKKGKKDAILSAEADAARTIKIKRRPGDKPGTHARLNNEDIKDGLKAYSAGKASELFKIGKGTTKADIKKQYRALAEQAHPDKPGGSKERFQQLTDAYNKILEKF
jgi:phage gp29-like protein